MAQLDNGWMNLSLPISQAEMALRDYHYSPQSGLESLRFALLSLQEITHTYTLHDNYSQRLTSFLFALDGLLASGSPYSERYHTAFLSASDALFQVAVGGQFGIDRRQQLDLLLSSERPCWAYIASFSDEKARLPTYVNYEALFVSSPPSPHRITVDAYLEMFSSSGRVSFQVDAKKDGFFEGRFLLESVQSLSWFKARFPQLQWRILAKNKNTALETLCQQSFLPLFQNTSIEKSSRYRLLERYEECFKSSFYQSFSTLFPATLSGIYEPERLVPLSKNATLFECDDGSVAFPVRHGGDMYVGTKPAPEKALNLSYLGCLGQDSLSYFLYEVDTGFGRFAFDQAEVLGAYAITDESLFELDGDLWFSAGESINAKVMLSMPLFSLSDSVYCILPDFITQVLVIKQAGVCVALPYSSLREVEGVCSQMQAPRSWVKNIWLNQQNEPLLEPWLLAVNELPLPSQWAGRNKPTHPVRNGYYFGKVCGRMIWLQAELVLAILPYRSPYSFTGINGDELSFESFIIYDGRCFDKVVAAVSDEEVGVSHNKNVYSVILDVMGESTVLPFASFEWCDSFPGEESEEVVSWLPNTKESDDKLHYASLQNNVVVDQKNYLSFVAGFWPSSSLA